MKPSEISAITSVHVRDKGHECVMSTNQIQADIQRRPAVTFTISQSAAYQKMLGIVEYFFTRPTGVNLHPFRGFLLEGPPATGKTEVAFQIAKTLVVKLARKTPPIAVEVRFIDSSVVAAPHWGEAEKRLSDAFNIRVDGNERAILIIDDIDGLLITRGSEIAKEWHYSINSVIFHRLDMVDPTRAMVIATTNRPDLIDEALRSRLYGIRVEEPRPDELLGIVEHMAKTLGIGDDSNSIARAVIQKLGRTRELTLRQIQNLLIEECIDSGLWGK